jgi:hemoglobin
MPAEGGRFFGVRSPYEQLGGETGLRALVRRFYAEMDTRAEAQGIRAMHPADLSGSEEKLFDFLSGWLGGPPLFHQKRGNPMLRFRHLPFRIGEDERDQWLDCMQRALAHESVPADLRETLLGALRQMADHLRNQEAP